MKAKSSTRATQALTTTPSVAQPAPSSRRRFLKGGAVAATAATAASASR